MLLVERSPFRLGIQLSMGNNVVCVDAAPISPFSWETHGFSGKASPSTAEPRRLEFKLLNEEKERPCPTSLKLSNQCKNRYCGVNAVEDTRVHLRSKSGEDDYINANFVDGIHQNSKAAYIATQAPLPETFVDFWTMVWDENVLVLVMLTRLNENCKHKADKYWPTSRRPKTFGEVTVKLEGIEKNARFQYKIKQFSLTRGSEKRIIKQYHFLAWPDHGVPSSPLPLLHMLQAVETYHAQRLQELAASEVSPAHSPMLIHCSAGIGRTGAFIIIHTVLKKLQEEGKRHNDVNMKELVARIRTQRSGCLTQSAQYLFCFDAVDMALRLNGTLSNELPDWSPDEYVTDEDDNASDGEDWYWETTRNDPALAWRHQSQVFMNPSYSDSSSDAESDLPSLKCTSLSSFNFLAYLACQGSQSSNSSPSSSTCVSTSTSAENSSASDLSSSSSVLSSCSEASYGSGSGSPENSELYYCK